MKIILVEDDPLYAAEVSITIKDHFENAEVIQYSNVAEFTNAIQSLCIEVPDAIILDMMLPWCGIGDLPFNNNSPNDYNFRSGGILCAKAALAKGELARVPIIIHSAASERAIEEELPPSVIYVGKGDSVKSLIRLLRGIILASKSAGTPTVSKDIFIVHGHDDEAKETVARFIEKLSGRAVVLHEQPNAGRTIIEKFEHHANVAFAIVLLTPDDVGGKTSKSLMQRARQNVVFELGFFFAKLGRNKVCALYKENVEIPSDIQGVIYTPMDKAGAWRVALARELKAAGIPLDYTKVI